MVNSFKTGDTIYNLISSSQTGVTFDIDVYRNGNVMTGITVNTSLKDGSKGKGIYLTSFSAQTSGDYQVVAFNNSTSATTISNLYQIRDNLGQNIYVGL